MEENTDILIEIVRLSKEEQENEPCKYKGLINAHTHGMEKFDLPNVCLGVDVKSEEVERIINTVIDIIMNPNEDNNILVTHTVNDDNGYTLFSFKLLPATSYGEEVFLIILADKDGKFPWEPECCRPYKYQINNHCGIKILHI